MEKNDFENNVNNENEEKNEKDSLMWNEEDYQVMEKITGFDAESVEKDQKKTLHIIALVFVCIVLLVIGILIGYNIPGKDTKPIITDNPVIPNMEMIYTRKNNMNELYLYIKDNAGTEHSVYELSKYSVYKYHYYNGKLYVFLGDENLSLMEVSLHSMGYNSNVIKTFENAGDSNIYYADNLIYFVQNNEITTYDLITMNTSKLDIVLDDWYILGINKNYILYEKSETLFVYNLTTLETKIVDKNILLANLIDDDKILYFTKERSEETVVFYEYEIGNENKIFVSEVSKNNSMLIDCNGYYLYSDLNELYLYDANNNKKIYEFDTNIIEMLYLNDEEIAIIPATYDADNCLNAENTIVVYNIKTKQVAQKRINDCLDKKVITDVLFAK